MTAGHDAPTPNDALLDAMLAVRAHLVGVTRASDVLPSVAGGTILHAGPPTDANELAPPSIGAIAGALVLEGRAPDVASAAAAVRRHEIEIGSTHDSGIVGPMTGVVSASMPLLVLEDPATGLSTYVTINEGLGAVLRFGANSSEVIERLRWIGDTVAPTLAKALDAAGPIDLVELQREALSRGDECHNRNKAATAQFVRLIAGAVARHSSDQATAADVLDFVSGNDHFFLNLSMAACKLAAEVARTAPGADGSTILTAIASNGVRMGIRIGTSHRWWTAPAPLPDVARWLDGYGRDDAAPLVGDSFATEVAGLGAFASGAAPAISSYIGGSVGTLLDTTERMYTICAREHPVFRIPYLDFRGAPVGIDACAVLRSGIAPVVNAGFAGRQAGVGQVGAGLVEVPLECFTAAKSVVVASGAPA